jgi:hypothetical protein
MSRLAPWILLGTLSLACGLGSSADDDIPAEVLSAGRAHMDCSANRFYCDALDRFESGALPDARAQSYSVLGRALWVRRDGATWQTSEQLEWLVARYVSMSFGEVTPDNDTEAQQIREALELLRAGQAPPPTHPVAQFVATLATQGEMPDPTVVRGRSRHFHDLREETDTYFRQNGSEIIAIEVRPDGMIVGVFRRSST